MEVSVMTSCQDHADISAGIGPKLVQSVLTAAFLFAFKDVLYDVTVKARATVAKKTA